MLTILTYLTFDKDANNWETIRVALIPAAAPLWAGVIGMGEAPIDVFRSRKDGRAYWESIGSTWRTPIGTLY